jgi:hypothetical protein
MDEGGGGWSDEGSSSRKRRKIDPPTTDAGAEAEAAPSSAPEEEAPSSSATTTSTQPSGPSSPSPPRDGGGEGDEEDEDADADALPLRRLIPPPDPDDWSAVVARARSHPREAGESYFGPAPPLFERDDERNDVDDDDRPRRRSHPHRAACPRCRPLHAMLLHDPPPHAVEAVLRAHPEAVLDATTFDGTTALRIAAERISCPGSGGDLDSPRLRVLRLLLVAELAMAMRGEVDRWRLRRRGGRRGRGGDPRSSPRPGGSGGGDDDDDDDNDDDDDGGRGRDVRSDANSVAFFGHNPIGWLTELSVCARTAAMLLKWYPVGAFQRRRSCRRRRPWDDDEEEVEEEDGDDDDDDDEGRGGGALGDRSQDDGADDSPLIRIVDDFARDNYDGLGGGAADNDDDDDGDADEVWNIGGGSGISNSDDYSSSGQSTGSASRIASWLQLRRERRRREQRWEKFLHILYATDSTLQSTRKPPPHDDDGGTLEEEGAIAEAADGSSLDPTAPASSDADRRVGSEAAAVAANATTAGLSTAIAAVTLAPPLSKHDASASVGENVHDQTEASSSTAAAAATMTAGSVADDALNGTKKSSVTPFHPVHAWLRCLASPNLGLEHCQAYGAWSVLRDMERRIPNEFTVRDGTDGNRTAFQTLAECKAKDCKLCPAEIRDIVECLMDANHRSAFL